MAELVLDERAELAERPVIFRDQEQRVVSEPARAPGSPGQPSATRTFGLEPDGPEGSASARRKAKRGARGVHPRRRRRPRAACGCWPRRRRVRRHNAPRALRGAAQGIHRQPGIVGDDPLTERPGGQRGFLRALPANVSASSIDLGRTGNRPRERIASRDEPGVGLPGRRDQLRPSRRPFLGCACPGPAGSGDRSAWVCS